jgi:hypothetical protein
MLPVQAHCSRWEPQEPLLLLWQCLAALLLARGLLRLLLQWLLV